MRSAGALAGRGPERSFYCPLDMEAKRAEYDQTAPHLFTVQHLPWESGTTVAEVTRALADHLDPDMESCSRVRRS